MAAVDHSHDERSLWLTLANDPIFRLTGVVLVLLAVPYAMPVMSAERLANLSSRFIDIVLTGLPVLAILHRLHRVEHPEERRFWRHLATGLSFWLLARLYLSVHPSAEQSVAEAIGADVLLLLFYMFVVQATETRPHRPGGWSTGDPAYRLESTGLVVFASALMVFFALIPSGVNPELYGSLLPSLYLFVALDVYLLVRFLMLTIPQSGRRWRTLYGLAATTAALWTLTDLLECLSYAGLVEVPAGTWMDLLWWPPVVTLVATARLREHPFEPLERAQTIPMPARPRSTPSALLPLAFALPTLHLALYALGLLDEASRAAREVAVLVSLAVLGGLAVLHQRLLERRNQGLESDLTSAHDRLLQAQKLEALGRLAGGVAHDFNNLLTAISGHSELALDQLPREHPARSQVEAVGRAGDQAAGLTRQLLAYSRRQVLEPRSLDLNQSVLEAQPMLRRLIREDIEIVVDLSDDLALVRADPGQLQQVVVNLAVNGRDAMPEGGRLTIGADAVQLDDAARAKRLGIPEGHYVRLTVRDTGEGMEPSTLTRIFEPFFTTKPQGRGTGLGLSTVFGIVQQSQGAVEVESSPGEGTLFSVWLLATTDPLPDDVDTPGATRAAHGAETVLLVEDDHAVLDLARTVLRRHDYDVLTARDGAEALARHRDHPGRIDLLLTDLILPSINGRVLAEQLSAQRPDMRVLFMSGYIDSTLPKADPATFLQKPFAPGTLADRVRQILDRR